MKRNDPYLAPVMALGDQLATAHTFSDVVDTFDETLATDAGFHAVCRSTESPVLDGVLDQLARRMSGERGRWSWLSPISRYAPAGFVHAVALVNGYYTLVLYFEERELGLVAVTGSTNHFFRFSAVTLPPGAHPAGPLGRA